MNNCIEKASALIFSNEEVIKRDMEIMLRKHIASLDFSKPTYMTLDDFSGALDEALQYVFRISCVQILESNGIEDCDIDEIDDVFELYCDLRDPLDTEYITEIEKQIDVIFNKAVESGFLQDSFDAQVQDLLEHLSIDLKDYQDCYLSSNEEVLWFHILLVGDSFFEHRILKKIDLMVQLTNIKKTEIIAAIKLYFTSGLSVSDSARQCGLRYPSTLSNAMNTLKKVEPIIDRISQLRETTLFKK